MIFDNRKDKSKEIYIIIENSCSEGYEEFQTFIFDDEETAHEKFEQLVADDKAFLEEEERDDVIERDGCWYQSYPEGEYAESHYTLDLFATEHNAKGGNKNA